MKYLLYDFPNCHSNIIADKLEDTHLKNIGRIERLFVLLTIAFAWVYLTEIYMDAYIKPVRTLKNGKRQKSLLKYELEESANSLINPLKKEKLTCLQFSHVLKGIS